MPDKKRQAKVDSPSKDTKKVKIDGSDYKNFNYDPVHFIRSHSKNNDPADIQTQIWEVGFMFLFRLKKFFSRTTERDLTKFKPTTFSFLCTAIC